MKDAFANAQFGMIGLFFFLGFFLCVLVWLIRPGAKKTLEEHRFIPLKDDDDEQ